MENVSDLRSSFLDVYTSVSQKDSTSRLRSQQDRARSPPVSISASKVVNRLQKNSDSSKAGDRSRRGASSMVQWSPAHRCGPAAALCTLTRALSSPNANPPSLSLSPSI
ncbi:Protein of unknown function [Pyronema omphalodes CBS 100304]|uniref:Uncharacterized protein n=1 Tax=Pyronema omphalodes (strain CBS 100304) TaxID=1076935 RepID=U4LCM7_PYROM|nr:Protein of unknown function [Pyronema omphalodes CBS 100304]